MLIKLVAIEERGWGLFCFRPGATQCVQKVEEINHISPV